MDLTMMKRGEKVCLCKTSSGKAVLNLRPHRNEKNVAKLVIQRLFIPFLFSEPRSIVPARNE